jgi:hypothetical protein
MKNLHRAVRGAVAAIALLGGCTTIETAQLSGTLAGKLQGQPVAIVVQHPSSFGVMRERAVILGPLSIPLMIAQGEHLRKSAGIADPADGIATALGDLLEQRHGAALLPARGATAHEEVESIVAASPEGARYVLTVATVSWGLARFPVRDATYSVTYVARARLIDVRTKAVIAEGGCLQGPAGDEFESTDYGAFTADGAAMIKSELARRTERCLHFITRDMLGA